MRPSRTRLRALLLATVCAVGGLVACSPQAATPLGMQAEIQAETQAGPTASPTGTPVVELVPGGPGDPVASVTGVLDVEAPGWSHADLAFVQMMIPHHRQALEMSALADDRAGSSAVRALAERIDAAQGPEILLMAGWLDAKGVAVPQAGDDPALWDHASHGHDGMAGMLSPVQMLALSAASGEEFDRLFLEGMIGHHEGALEMARDVLREGTDPRVLELADEVNAGQAAEIARMEQMLAAL